MSSRRARTGLVVLAATVALVAGCSTSGRRAATPPPTSVCDTALFVGVRGSGELQTAQRGMGAESGDTFTRLVAKVGASKVEGVGLTYPATSVPSWLTHLPGTPGSYSWSVDEGVRSLTSLTAATLARCPQRQIVVAGHSQGANVVDEFLHTAPAATLARLRAAVVYGDPTFAWDRPYARGSFEHRDGLLGTPADAQPPEQVWPALRSYCRGGDIVCQLRGGEAVQDVAHFARTLLSGDLTEHVRYVRAETADAAGFIAGRLA